MRQGARQPTEIHAHEGITWLMLFAAWLGPAHLNAVNIDIAAIEQLTGSVHNGSGFSGVHARGRSSACRGVTFGVLVGHQ
jgi:hypothetical protein